MDPDAQFSILADPVLECTVLHLYSPMYGIGMSKKIPWIQMKYWTNLEEMFMREVAALEKAMGMTVWGEELVE